MARGFNPAAGFAGGIYAELGLETGNLEIKLSAAQDKLKMIAGSFDQLDRLIRSGYINWIQYANGVQYLNEKARETRGSIRDLAQALTDRVGQGPSQFDKFVQGLEKVRAASGFTGRGFLQLAYAIDDVQYGFRSIVNNIPLIVTQFGGSAGLAAIAQIAAVAFNQLGMSYQDFAHMAKGTQIGDLIEDWKRWKDQLTKTREEIEGVATDYAKMRHKMAEEGSPDREEAKGFQRNVGVAEGLERKLSKEDQEKVDAVKKGIANTPGGAELIEGKFGAGRRNVLEVDKNRADVLEKRIDDYERQLQESKKFGNSPEQAEINEHTIRRRAEAVKELTELRDKGANMAKAQARAALGDRLTKGGADLENFLKSIENDPNLKDVHANIRKAIDESRTNQKAEKDRKKKQDDDDRKERLGINKMAGIYQEPMKDQLHESILRGISGGKSTEDAISDAAKDIEGKLTDVNPANRRAVAIELATRIGEKTGAEVDAHRVGGMGRAQAAQALIKEEEDKKNKAGNLREQTEQQRKTDAQAKELLKNDLLKAKIARGMVDEGANPAKDALARSARIKDISKMMADAIGGDAKPEDFKDAASLILGAMNKQFQEEVQAYAFEHQVTHKKAAKEIVDQENEKAIDRARTKKEKEERQLLHEADLAIPGIGKLTRGDLERRIMAGGFNEEAFDKTEADIAKALEQAGMDPEKAAKAAKVDVAKQEHDLLKDANIFMNKAQPLRQSVISGASEEYSRIHSALQGDGDTSKKSLMEQMKMRTILEKILSSRQGVLKLQIE